MIFLMEEKKICLYQEIDFKMGFGLKDLSLLVNDLFLLVATQ